jgi:UDP-2,3-diacylglucosamine pyrophosphatase LpxH
MKKIKVIISDFHIGTGRFLEDRSPNILEDFHNEKQFIEFLEYYSTGKYSRYKVELIINGDFFNFLQIEYEKKNHTVITESLSVYQMEQIIKGWPRIFEALAKFNKSSNNQITFISGNHDPQLLWDRVRELLKETVGGSIVFYNLVYTFDGFHIEHGHQHDSHNKVDPKKLFLYKKIPEPILNIPWTTRFCIDVLSPIKKVKPIADKIKPFKSFLTWILIHDTKFFFYSVFKSFVYMLKSIFFPSRYFKFPLIEIFKLVLDLSLTPNLSSYAKQILKEGKTHTVIFGHSHAAKYIQFENDMEYLNTGTWTSVTSLNLTDMGTKRFLSYAVIKYAKDARPRAKLKRWRGNWKITEDVF